MLHKIFDKNLAIGKSKLALKLNKPAYIGMCILELKNALIYKFHYNYMKINMTTNQNFYSQTLIN